jgi:hypothetical protein
MAGEGSNGLALPRWTSRFTLSAQKPSGAEDDHLENDAAGGFEHAGSALVGTVQGARGIYPCISTHHAETPSTCRMLTAVCDSSINFARPHPAA